MAQSVERKLTTILCADVYGYSKLMEQDEVATLAMLKVCRDAIDGLIARHRGRVVSTAGDSLLADFPSVVEAVRCAVEIQQELAGRNRSLPDGRRMAFRIGINLGDVMVEGAYLPQDFWASVKSEAEQNLNRYAEPLRAKGLTVEVIVREGYPATVIEEEAVELEADLIVIGTRGLSGLKHLLLGSIAERVVQKSPCPVLTVKTHD
jgi:nucleotide-binding universal stress UspA family protein